MQFIFCWHFLTLVFYWLSALPNIAYGSLRIKTDTNEVLSLSTLDYFLYRQPYYEYEGTGINWPWKNNTVNCEMQAFNVSDPSIRHITLRRFNYTNVAIFVNVGDALAAGCHTIAQIGNEIKSLSQQFVKAGLAPVKLMGLMVSTNATIPYWGPNSFGYRTIHPSEIPDGPPSIDAMLLDQSASKLFHKANMSVYSQFYFEATQESGPWNQVFLSSGFTIYQYILFSLVLGMAVYTCIRTVRLIFINELPRNLYWITFSILIIYSTMFMVYLNNLGLSYIQTIIGEVTAFLGEISCSMALLYWVVIDKQTLPRLTLTWFRIIILSDMMVSNATFVLNMCFLNSNEQQDTNIAIGLDWSYILPQFSIVGFIVFSGFALRFGYHAYKMRLYTEMQRGILKFTLLVALTAILCAFSATKFFMYCFWHLQYGLETINEMAVIEVTKHTVFTVRALACSMALGLHWPNKKEQSKRNSTLSGKTVVESDSASSKIEERKSSAGHYSILEKPPKAHTSTTVPGVQVSDSSLNGINTENR